MIGGTSAMKNVVPTHTAVKNSRNGIRPEPRSDSAPRIGDTSALSPTLATTAIDSRTFPSRSPNWASLTRYRPIAPDTTANEKIVLAKSYSAHETGTIVRPLAVIPARPRPRTGEDPGSDGAALVTAR